MAKLFDPNADVNAKPNPFVNDPGGVRSKKAALEKEIQKSNEMASTPPARVRVKIPDGVDRDDFMHHVAKFRPLVGAHLLPDLVFDGDFVEGVTPGAYVERSSSMISDIFKDMAKYPHIFRRRASAA